MESTPPKPLGTAAHLKFQTLSVYVNEHVQHGVSCMCEVCSTCFENRPSLPIRPDPESTRHSRPKMGETGNGNGSGKPTKGD